jgi:hypothetical protein
MNHPIEFTTPAPSCLLPATHRSRAVTPACNTDIRRTISEHTLPDLDDYDRVLRDDWLSAPGGFRHA